MLLRDNSVLTASRVTINDLRLVIWNLTSPTMAHIHFTNKYQAQLSASCFQIMMQLTFNI